MRPKAGAKPSGKNDGVHGRRKPMSGWSELAGYSAGDVYATDDELRTPHDLVKDAACAGRMISRKPDAVPRGAGRPRPGFGRGGIHASEQNLGGAGTVGRGGGLPP